jgi:hypothetical protein
VATLADVTAVVTDRCGAYLQQAQIETGETGAPSVNQAVAWALRALGYPVASLRMATDAEVLAVGAAQVDALLDLVELRTLESVQTNLTAVKVSAGPVEEDYNHLADRLAKIVNEKRANCAARHGQWLTVPLTGNAPKRASLRAV